MLHPRTITLLTSLFLLILCFNALAETAGLPSVRFAATQYEITEHYTDAWFQLVITDPPEVAIPILFNVTGGTATEWEDFNVDDNAAWFYPGGSDTISWYVQIWEDEFVEGPETIELTLNDESLDYVVGSPHQATITIIDDDTASPPEMRLGSTQYSITEELTEVSIPVIRSGPLVENSTFVYISVTEGTAVAGTDFEMIEVILVEFRQFESDTSFAHFIIYEDEDPEDPETLFLAIDDGGETYSVGNPGSATMTIIDDDSETSMAHFEYPGNFPLDPYGNIALVSHPGAVALVDVVVEDMPPEGATIHYSSSADGLIHTLVFSSSPRQTIEVPTAEIPSGQAYAVNQLRLLNPAAKGGTGSGGLDYWTWSNTFLEPSVVDCVICYTEYVFKYGGPEDCEELAYTCGWDCSPLVLADKNQSHFLSTKSASSLSDFEIFLRYRDEILTGAPGGDFYIQLYRDYSPAMANAILQHPTLIYRVRNTWDLWLPAVAAQVDGQGANFIITGEMQAALLGVMAEFEEVGSPELAQLMAEFRLELDLENIAGTTASDLQAAIETNPMETQRATWGGVKALYRERD